MAMNLALPGYIMSLCNNHKTYCHRRPLSEINSRLHEACRTGQCDVIHDVLALGADIASKYPD